MALNLVGTANWDMYKSLMRDAQETFANKPITWFRSNGGLDRFQEDNSTETFTQIELKCLIDYNVFRKWPVTRTMEIGEQDKENLVVLMNKQYLDELGYINAAGNFAFNPAADYFVLDGRKMKAMGDSDSSQDDNEALWTFVILKYEELLTGQNRV